MAMAEDRERRRHDRVVLRRTAGLSAAASAGPDQFAGREVKLFERAGRGAEAGERACRWIGCDCRDHQLHEYLEPLGAGGSRVAREEGC